MTQAFFGDLAVVVNVSEMMIVPGPSFWPMPFCRFMGN
jgi:hypothetical protein